MKKLWLLLAAAGCGETVVLAAPPPRAALSAPSDGFEGDKLDASWKVVNGEMMSIAVSGGELHLTPNRNCVWYFKDRGPGLFKEVTGDFKSGGNFGRDGKYGEFLQVTAAKALEDTNK